MLRVIAICVCVLSLALVCLSAEPPATMKIISMKILAPQETPGETYWLADHGHVRVEIPADITGAPTVMIVNDPNMWIVDLTDKTARHVLDKHPPLVSHFPVCNNAADPQSRINALEFGYEMDFVKSAGIHPTAITFNNHPARRYEMTFDVSTIVFVTSDADVPLRVTCEGAGHKLSMDYLRYDVVKTDPNLFAPPTGVTIHDEQ